LILGCVGSGRVYGKVLGAVDRAMVWSDRAFDVFDL
jgi:hypothetical protein